MKLQDAFVSETGTTFGSWKMIGYNMNTTNNVFTYDDGNVAFNKETAALSTTAAEVWSATPKAALNECKTTDKWSLEIKSVNGENGAAYNAKVSSTECNVLVPGFGKLDKTGAATIGGGNG